MQQQFLNNILTPILDDGIVNIKYCKSCEPHTKYESNVNHNHLKEIIKNNNHLLNIHDDDDEFSFIKYIFKTFKQYKRYGYKDFVLTNEHLNPKYGYSELVLHDYEAKQHEKNFFEYQYYAININISKFIGFKCDVDDIYIIPYMSLLFNAKNFLDNTIQMIIKVKSTVDLEIFRPNITLINDFYTFVNHINSVACNRLTTITLNTCQYVKNVILLFYNPNAFKSVYGHYTQFYRIGCTNFRINPCQLFKLSGHVIPDIYRESIQMEYKTFTFPNDINRISLTNNQVKLRATYFQVINSLFNMRHLLLKGFECSEESDIITDNDDDDEDYTPKNQHRKRKLSFTSISTSSSLSQEICNEIQVLTKIKNKKIVPPLTMNLRKKKTINYSK